MLDGAPRVSVIIPVYRESEVALETIRALVDDPYQNKEVLVAVDEPEERFVEEAERIGARLIVSERRRGKVEAANEAAGESTGDLLLFLDSDIAVEPGFVTSAVSSMGNRDMVEFAKVGFGRGLIASLASVDYVIYDAMLELGSRATGHSIMMNGSAFMIRREAFERIGGFRRMYSEDLDLATRGFKLGLRYALVRSPRVFVMQPSTFNEWLNQRVRWGYGLTEWAFAHVRDLLKSTSVLPLLFLSLLVMLIPSMTAAGLMYTLSTPLGAPLISFVEVALYTYKLSLPLRATAELGFIRTVFALVITPAIVIPLYYFFHRVYGARAGPLQLLIYYYVYQPLLATIYIISAALYLLKSRVELEWVV